MTSIFEGQPSKTRPFSIKTRVVWVIQICHPSMMPIKNQIPTVDDWNPAPPGMVLKPYKWWDVYYQPQLVTEVRSFTSRAKFQGGL